MFTWPGGPAALTRPDWPGGTEIAPILVKEDESSEGGYALALRMIETGRVDTVSMVTHRFPLGSVVEAIETVTNREAIKVAVLPGG